MSIRLAIVHSDDGKVDTGLVLPGCSPSNINPCQPQTFNSFQEAQSWSQSHGEYLYVVGDAVPGSKEFNALVDQVWAYVANPSTIPSSSEANLAAGGLFSSPVALIALGLIAYFLFLRK